MRRVILESPFGANPPLFIAYARACVKDCLRRDEAALASHLLYTQPGVLDDTIPNERETGIRAGLIWYEFADAAVVYRDYGVSVGMAQGIEIATRLGLPVEYRSLPMINGRGDLSISLLERYPGVGRSFPGGLLDIPALLG